MSWGSLLFAAVFTAAGVLAVGIDLLGVQGSALLLSGLLLFLFLAHERLLARLIAWGIRKTRKAFVWSIERVIVRPRLSRAPGAWSEVVIQSWTWHNPPGFEKANSTGYILQIDRLTLRFDLWSVFDAARFRHAVHVDLVLVEGLRLKTERNAQGALNLWEALDLLDQDVNVSTIVQHSRQLGGLRDHEEGSEDTDDELPMVRISSASSTSTSVAVVRPLPEESTEATREAACHRVLSPSPSPLLGTRSDFRVPLLLPEKPETPVSDPRRRPRWGVPLRFNIRQLMLLQIELGILDLLVPSIDPGDQARHDPEGTVVRIARLALSRRRLEHGDRRRTGSEDGVRGVYLGELVWVLIAEVVPVALYASPSRMLKNAAIAAGFAVRHAGVHMAVRLVELARHAGHKLQSLGERRRPALDDQSCRVQVHLIAGRQVTRKGKSVNVHALLELHNPASSHWQGGVVDWCRSESQLLTKAPKWGEVFELGPATSVTSSLRIACFHRKSVDVIGLAHHKESIDSPLRLIGEVLLPLTALLIRDKVIETGGEIVGWFPLTDPHGLSEVHQCTGQLKLGLRVVNRHCLGDLHTAARADGEGGEEDYVVLE